MDSFFDEILRAWSYPRMGEIKRYKVVPMTDNDIFEEKIKEIEERIARKKKLIDEYQKGVAELEEELQKQKKRLNP